MAPSVVFVVLKVAPLAIVSLLVLGYCIMRAADMETDTSTIR